jgi:uncharacterized lipoprotein YmbA
VKRLFWLILTMCLLSGCGSGPPPRLYLLEPVQALDQPIQTPGSGKALISLGMSPVILPVYANDAQIASLASDGTVTLDNSRRWAEEPGDAISRVLADRLRAHSAATVLIEPWPRDYAPTARIEVLFDRLLREPLGGAEMSGQIQLLSGDGRRLLKVLPFQIVHYGSDTDMRVFFYALSLGIDDIARMAVQALLEMKIKS